MLQYINEVYQKTDWDPPNGMKGYGIQLKRIIIHTEYTKTLGHYNQKCVTWTAQKKLEAFYRNAPVSLKNFCLGHLVTSYSFADGTLGLSVVASPDGRYPGGICTRSARLKPEDIRKPVYPNVALSTGKGMSERFLLKLQFELVMAHEIGHCWGANHDPDTDECAPGSEVGGKFIMWYSFISGVEENNDVFSPCSKRDIALVLKAKADRCFVEDTAGTTIFTDRALSPEVTVNKGDKPPDLCGNAVINHGEECDVGLVT
nr:hypothetical protein BaRGS_033187 [Batillaria attramentaria]